ncbi:MAG: hypothetical protein ACRYFZ_18360 [Janthinobacterium lividum]
MKTRLPLLLLTGSTLFSSCASIVSHSRWPVALTSAPVGASVAVVDRNGKEVFTGTTPVVARLKSGTSYFKRAKYTITFTKAGYAKQTLPLEAGMNGWYFGNLLLGGALGMLIIDPITGAMYRIKDKQVQATLSQATGFNSETSAPNGLRIVSLDEVPSQLRPSLVQLPQAK